MTNPDSTLNSSDAIRPPEGQTDRREPGRHRGDGPGVMETLAAAFRRRNNPDHRADGA